MDYARLELLKLLGEHDHARVKVREDYADLTALANARLLVTYTCEVIPDDAQTAALEAFVRDGGRWLALHGTNSVLKYAKGKGWEAPRTAPGFMRLLGSQFVAHPPIAPYRVRLTRNDDP